MSTAHELIERDFEVEVFDRLPIPGGKARSLLATDARRPDGTTISPEAIRAYGPVLPGEHGFRFFPGFYKHVIDTMSRTPVNGGSASDNLVDALEVRMAPFDRPSFSLPVRFPTTTDDLRIDILALVAVLGGRASIPPDEVAFFAHKTWQFLTTCDERRLSEYEQISWWEFIEADRKSSSYQKYFGHGFTRSLVAAKARRASARTVGAMFMQMLFHVVLPDVPADRLLNGPTNDVWLDPWLHYLVGKGVKYHSDTTVRAINCKAGRVRSVTVRCDEQDREVFADYFVAALPVERMADLVTTELLAAAPSLATIKDLVQYVEWMNGIQFYLNQRLDVARGHVLYVDSPWALTSVSQAQFWPGIDLARYGDGTVREVISVAISDWSVSGLNGKEARACTREEVAAEVWAQLKRSLGNEKAPLTDAVLHSWFLDPDITAEDPTKPARLVNAEPLLVNYVDTWRLRPEAWTGVANLFLASDYVRTYTDLATMEAANEAARRAVNAILIEARSPAEPCKLWKLQEPIVFEPLRAYDRERWENGLPWRQHRHASDSIRSALPQSLKREPPLGALALAEQLAAYRDLVLPEIAAAIPRQEPRRHLYDLIERCLSRAGKGFRPALCIATCCALGGDSRRAVPSAAALEVLHNAFLVHDDIEDLSEFRRGRPTLHRECGVPLAINVGDAMNAMSLRILRSNAEVLGPKLAWCIFDEFDHLMRETMEGQALELGWIQDNMASITEEDYLHMVLKKTCWYSFIHPLRVGALIAEVDWSDFERWNALGYFLGAAFQIQDDILNLIGDTAKYGKEIGGDLFEGKRTLMIVHLLQHASPFERERLFSFLSKPRRLRLAREVDLIMQLFDKYGSIDHARSRAREFTARAQAEFASAFSRAAPGRDLEFLHAFLDHVTSRQY